MATQRATAAQREELRSDLIARGVDADRAARIARHHVLPGEDFIASVPAGSVVGKNLREIREKLRLTQDEAAAELRMAGLPWTRNQIAALETGKRESVDILTAVLISTGLNVQVSELFAGDGDVHQDDTVVPLWWLREVLEGMQPNRDDVFRFGVASRTARDEKRTASQADDIEATDLSDASVAQALSVKPEHVREAAVELWGHSFREERDRRVAELGDLTRRQRQAHRGHATRAMVREIREHLTAKRREKVLARVKGRKQ